MKLYYSKSHYNKHFREMVFPLLKPFIKSNDFTDEQRKELYGVSQSNFEFTEDIETADLVILTMAWNYYVNTQQIELARGFVEECAKLEKIVMVFNAADFGVKVPYLKNIVIFRSSGYKSKFSKKEYSLPAFIPDPLIRYFDTQQAIFRTYHAKPVVGFCGQANLSWTNTAKELIHTWFRNQKFYLRISPNEPQKVSSTSFLRASILKTLKRSPDVIDNFILRKNYRAGVKRNKEEHFTTLEFYNNIKDSDYVICVRGAGNFSVRFYETLAMGRIPIFINTDCALPLESDIDWKSHLVWVDYKDRHDVSQILLDFHLQLDQESLIALFKKNRKLWEEKLTLSGFFRNQISCFESGIN